MDFFHYVGIDIATATLDWAVYSQQGSLLHMHTPNTTVGIKKALRQLKTLPGWDMTHVIFCMEHTGIYNAHVLEFLHKLHLPIWLESSLQIKQAGGMQRGKNDTVDAYRIADRVAGAIRLSVSRSDSLMDAPSSCHSAVGFPQRGSSAAYSSRSAGAAARVNR
jgi:transposase